MLDLFILINYSFYITIILLKICIIFDVSFIFFLLLLFIFQFIYGFIFINLLNNL